MALCDLLSERWFDAVQTGETCWRPTARPGQTEAACFVDRVRVYVLALWLTVVKAFVSLNAACKTILAATSHPSRGEKTSWPPCS